MAASTPERTQVLEGAAGARALTLVGETLWAARLSDLFPASAGLRDLCRCLVAGIDEGVYAEALLDARTGLPNLASVTRVATDRELYQEGRVPPRREGGLATAYGAMLGELQPSPVDDVQVRVRRYDPDQDRVELRVQVTKLDGGGRFSRVSVELTVAGGAVSARVLDMDERAVRVALTTEIEAMIYRHAGFDAELLLARLDALDGVAVRRVERGMVGPVLFADGPASLVVEAEEASPLVEGWLRLSGQLRQPAVAAAFQSEVAGRDVARDVSNDPLRPSLEARLTGTARDEHQEWMRQAGVRVVRDCRFVATRTARALIDAVCAAAETRNLIRALR